MNDPHDGLCRAPHPTRPGLQCILLSDDSHPTGHHPNDPLAQRHLLVYNGWKHWTPHVLWDVALDERTGRPAVRVRGTIRTRAQRSLT